MSETIQHTKEKSCFHCGEACDETPILFQDKNFCCQGCQLVYEILSENGLKDYYRLEQKPGISQKRRKNSTLDYLDNQELVQQLLEYRDDKMSKITLQIPQIHCSSCIWLLENLYQLQPAVLSSRVNFVKKEVYISFSNQISLKELIVLLGKIGYNPELSLDSLGANKKKPALKRIYYQLGLAGFAFGNIMLMSLPGYFGLDSESAIIFNPVFGYLSLLLATPVALYSGQDYFKSAYYSLKNKRLNIDVPIALGILVLYLQSSIEVISRTGMGYFDSLCGLLFFLLLGRIFQEKTYEGLAFERDYKAYFPISVSKLSKSGIEKSVPINSIKKGDKIRIRNGEIIPVDSRLINGEALIDNSFLSGESKPIAYSIGDAIFAGGKQEGGAIIVECTKPLNQSKLTRLWNEQKYAEKSSSSFSKLTDQISQWFTPLILVIALISAAWHFQESLEKAISVFSAVLIVACPCALALAAPFTFGHASRVLGRKSCFLRDSFVVEDLAKVDHIVFDKTGTLTYARHRNINYKGKYLIEAEISALRTLLFQSTHPLSRIILDSLALVEIKEINKFREIPGKGMEAEIEGEAYKLGSAKWLKPELVNEKESIVVLLKNEEFLGYYTIHNEYRPGLSDLIQQLKKGQNLSVLSGDNESQKAHLMDLFGQDVQMNFQQSPEDKLQAIKKLQAKGNFVMMVGDGLNDAGALKQSDVGLAIVEDGGKFSPSSDIILQADKFEFLANFLGFAKRCKKILILGFIISLLYNVLGLSFAVQGLLSPVFAAVLMPLSSITVVVYSSLAVQLISGSLVKK